MVFVLLCQAVCDSVFFWHKEGERLLAAAALPHSSNQLYALHLIVQSIWRARPAVQNACGVWPEWRDASGNKKKINKLKHPHCVWGRYKQSVREWCQRAKAFAPVSNLDIIVINYFYEGRSKAHPWPNQNVFCIKKNGKIASQRREHTTLKHSVKFFLGI